jgi:ABC-type Zn uptake system ZnuABC Zn-binding protein ZnuA
MTEIQEGVELPEFHESHREYRYTLPVSLTISILAVLVAGATLLGHRAHTEELLLQSRASDQWAYYQAKNIRFHEVQSIADLLGALAPAEKQKTEAIREKYLKEVERYQGDKEDISEKAKEFEKERDVLSRRADRFDGGEALLEVGLVICSITLLTKRRMFWIGGALVGALGVVMALTGLFLH